MTISNDPACRLKAQDSRPFIGADAATADEYLHRLTVLHGLKAVGVIQVARNAVDVVRCYAYVSPDLKVLDTFLRDWSARAINPEAQYGALVVGVRDDGVIDTATWGASRADCAGMAAWRDTLELTPAPFQTWFGYGNGGKPLAFTAEQRAGLTPSQLTYVDAHTHPRALRP
ncbi:hypothetical protein GURKE_02170 [Brevundimonas phage vB_BpoS-Gurke]|uniref:Uncharacterized protein n=1 Tax=Brevundimonas phage vB_BpoS-Gurke TaxID=2948599 RepID=A0A9E7SQJ3_9CAUD|nr:hypothetical protein GURKE_02170 [Brevundimonas phage vB_BpoS-Gurke]